MQNTPLKLAIILGLSLTFCVVEMITLTTPPATGVASPTPIQTLAKRDGALPSTLTAPTATVKEIR